jgi:hypothetical protein
VKHSLWLSGILFIAAIISILAGMWFSLGGPYMTAYLLLAGGTGMGAVALILVSFCIIKNRAKKGLLTRIPQEAKK